MHGLQLPLHPLQVAGWLALATFTVGSFLVLVPALRQPCRTAVGSLLAALYAVHACTHLGALLLDPAEPQLRANPVHVLIPEFDRSKHAHVIENGRCHLCNVFTTSARTKHCSVCNKCVARFDHHCKWLNQCIGGRNYAIFFMCVATAVAAAIGVALLALAEIVLYYVEPSWLVLWESAAESFISSVHNDTDPNPTSSTTSTTTPTPAGGSTAYHPAATATTSLSSSFVSSDVAFLIVVAVLGLLAAITAGLLLHLCFFHVYISFLGLTTYEYIRTHRQSQATNGSSQANTPGSVGDMSLGTDTASTACHDTGPPAASTRTATLDTRCNVDRRPSSLHCCQQRSQLSVYACAVLESQPDRCNGCSGAYNTLDYWQNT